MVSCPGGILILANYATKYPQFPPPHTGWSTWCLQSQKPGAVFISLLSLGAETLQLQSCAELLPWHEVTHVIQHAWPLVELRSPWLVQQLSWTDTIFLRQQPVKRLSGACLNQHVVHRKLPFWLWFLWDGGVKFVYTWKCSRNSCADI